MRDYKNCPVCGLLFHQKFEGQVFCGGHKCTDKLRTKKEHECQKCKNCNCEK